MKWDKLLLTVLFLSILPITDCFSQVKVKYENPPIYAREASGQIPTYRGDFNDSGHLLIDAEDNSITMVSDTREQRKFTFFDINREPVSGHFLGFGNNIMMNFIPEDRLLILMYKRNHTYNFFLTQSESSSLIQEFNNYLEK